MLCGMIRKKNKTGTPVYINVYDLMPVNRYAYWFGLGFYHSGVQVYGVEYAFGGSDSSKPGVVKLDPKHFQGLHVRKSILIGRTELSEKECQEFIKKVAKEYPGNSYNIIYRNCNHFANDTCKRLTKKSIPGWVNRLARLNFLYSCLLPDGWNEIPPRPAVIAATHNVYGVECAFSGSDSSKPGLVKLGLKHFQGLHVRKSILIGRTELSEKECQFIKKVAKECPGNSYNIIYRNCNHFANDTCKRLTKKSIPGWVNRLARLNFLYSYLLPDGWNEIPPTPSVVATTHNSN